MNRLVYSDVALSRVTRECESFLLEFNELYETREEPLAKQIKTIFQEFGIRNKTDISKQLRMEIINCFAEGLQEEDKEILRSTDQLVGVSYRTEVEEKLVQVDRRKIKDKLFSRYRRFLLAIGFVSPSPKKQRKPKDSEDSDSDYVDGAIASAKKKAPKGRKSEVVSGSKSLVNSYSIELQSIIPEEISSNFKFQDDYVHGSTASTKPKNKKERKSDFSNLNGLVDGLAMPVVELTSVPLEDVSPQGEGESKSEGEAEDVSPQGEGESKSEGVAEDVSPQGEGESKSEGELERESKSEGESEVKNISLTDLFQQFEDTIISETFSLIDSLFTDQYNTSGTMVYNSQIFEWDRKTLEDGYFDNYGIKDIDALNFVSSEKLLYDKYDKFEKIRKMLCHHFTIFLARISKLNNLEYEDRYTLFDRFSPIRYGKNAHRKLEENKLVFDALPVLIENIELLNGRFRLKINETPVDIPTKIDETIVVNETIPQTINETTITHDLEYPERINKMDSFQSIHSQYYDAWTETGKIFTMFYI